MCVVVLGFCEFGDACWGVYVCVYVLGVCKWGRTVGRWVGVRSILGVHTHTPQTPTTIPIQCTHLPPLVLLQIRGGAVAVQHVIVRVERHATRVKVDRLLVPECVWGCGGLGVECGVW